MEKQELLQIVAEVCGIESGRIGSGSKMPEVVCARRIAANMMWRMGMAATVKEVASELGVHLSSGYNLLFHPPIERHFEKCDRMKAMYHTVLAKVGRIAGNEKPVTL